MTNQESILKSRVNTLPKGQSGQGYVFLTQYSCESWIVKKAENQRIEPFGLQYWRRLLRVHWTASRSKQSILKEISPGLSLKDWCWSWYSNTVATSCEALTDWKKPWCWEGPGAGGEGDDKMTWLDVITESMDMDLKELWEVVMDREPRDAPIHGVSKSWTWLSDWIELNWNTKTEYIKNHQGGATSILQGKSHMLTQLCF